MTKTTAAKSIAQQVNESKAPKEPLTSWEERWLATVMKWERQKPVEKWRMPAELEEQVRGYEKKVTGAIDEYITLTPVKEDLTDSVLYLLDEVGGIDLGENGAASLQKTMIKLLAFLANPDIISKYEGGKETPRKVLINAIRQIINFCEDITTDDGIRAILDRYKVETYGYQFHFGDLIEMEREYRAKAAYQRIYNEED